MADQNKKTVEKPCSAYNTMAAKWKKTDSLMGGTDAMRSASDSFLPRFEAESDKNYNARLNMTQLFAAYKKTVKSLAGKPFTKQVGFKEEEKLPEQQQNLDSNIDNNKTSIEEFGNALLEKAIDKGLTHILIDFPHVANEDGETPNLKQERDAGAKPYFVQIPPENLIGWRFGDDGKLDRIRIKETVTEADGDWGEKTTQRIRVIYRDTWEIWTKDDKDVYGLTDSGVNTLGEIALVTLYLNKTGNMTGESCLEELADENINHWTTTSYHKICGHMAGSPVFTVTGITEKELEDKLVVGGHHYLRLSNPEAKAYWVEHSGAALRALRDDLEAIEQRMEMLGNKPLVQKSGNQTATGKAIDQSNSDSDMQAWVRLLESALRSAYEYAAKWISKELPEEFQIDIFNEFSLLSNGIESAKIALETAKIGKLSTESLLEIYKSTGAFPAHFNIEVEQERLGSEGPALGLLGKDDLEDEE